MNSHLNYFFHILQTFIFVATYFRNFVIFKAIIFKDYRTGLCINNAQYVYIFAKINWFAVHENVSSGVFITMSKILHFCSLFKFVLYENQQMT